MARPAKKKTVGDLTHEEYEDLGAEVALMLNRTTRRANKKLSKYGLHVSVSVEFSELKELLKPQLNQELRSES